MIEAVYTVNVKEFTEASKAYCKPMVKKLPGRLIVQIVTALFIVLVVFTMNSNPLWLNVGLCASLLTLFLIQKWREKAVPAYHASSYAEYNEEVFVRLDDDGFYSDKAGLCTSRMAWAAFTGWLETENMFVIGMRLSWVPIPKSAFNASQQNELREMFRSRITARP